MTSFAPASAGADDLDAMLAQVAPIADLWAHGMTVSTPDGRFVLVNDAFCELVGRSRNELLTLRFEDITHPSDNAEAAERTATALARGDRGATIDKRYVHANGSDVHARISSTIVRSPTGETICFLTQVTDLTELRAAQDRSRASEQRADEMISSATDGYISIDGAGQIREWNPAAVRLFGWSREEALGVELGELLIPSEFREAHRAGLARYSATGETVVVGTTLDLVAITKDGVRLPVEVRIWAAPRAGRDLVFHAFLRDVRERREAAAAAQRHSAVFASIGDAVFLTRGDGSILDTNPAGERLFGRSRRELIGLSVSGLLDEDSDVLIPMVRDSLNSTGSWAGDLSFTRADGERRVSAAVIRPMVGPDGAAQGFLAVHRDVTEARRATAALAEAEARYRLLAENSSDIISQTAADGTLLYVSPSYERIFGQPAGTLVGRPLSTNVHPDDQATLAQALADVLGGAPVRAQLRRQRADGSWVWLESSSSPLRDPATGAVVGIQSASRDVTDRHAAEMELERRALSDALTGLANRPLLTDRLRHAQHRLNREPGHVALLMLDLDRFKLVNDTLGHSIGDALLVAVAERLRACARPTDTVARLGGDEFVVLLDGLTDPAEAAIVAERILASLRAPLTLPGHEPLAVCGSVGIALTADADHPAEALFREADLALYRAKEEGRDRYALFDSGLRLRVLAQVKAERQLRRALSEDLLELHYQPILRLSDLSPIGAEALVRLHDPDQVGVLVMPETFIEAAEDSGLIADLDLWVLHQAAQQLAADPSGGSLSTVAINVSPRSMLNPRFCDRVTEALALYEIDPARLWVEVTERTLLDATGSGLRSLERLRKMGIRVGIDDFGTGYSALGYLQRLPLDFIKIDRSFTQRLPDSEQARTTVEAITIVAHAHDLTVTAEGVETPAQLAAVTEIGCDYVQGFLTGRPAPQVS